MRTLWVTVRDFQEERTLGQHPRGWGWTRPTRKAIVEEKTVSKALEDIFRCSSFSV